METKMSNYDQTQKTTSSVQPGNAPASVEKHPERAKNDTLTAEIKKSWNKLSDEDVRLYDRNPEQFFGKLKELHGVSKEDAQKRLAEIKTASASGERAA
jgi:hypothetical protein